LILEFVKKIGPPTTEVYVICPQVETLLERGEGGKGGEKKTKEGPLQR